MLDLRIVSPCRNRSLVIENRIRESADTKRVVTGDLVIGRGLHCVTGSSPMVRELHAGRPAVGSSLQFGSNRFVEWTHAFGQKLAVENLLRQRVAEANFAGCRRFIGEQAQRASSFERVQDGFSVTAERDELFDGKTLAEDRRQGDDLAILFRQAGGAG